jgi:hypothetical protein
MAFVVFHVTTAAATENLVKETLAMAQDLDGAGQDSGTNEVRMYGDHGLLPTAGESLGQGCE